MYEGGPLPTWKVYSLIASALEAKNDAGNKYDMVTVSADYLLALCYESLGRRGLDETLLGVVYEGRMESSTG